MDPQEPLVRLPVEVAATAPPVNSTSMSSSNAVTGATSNHGEKPRVRRPYSSKVRRCRGLAFGNCCAVNGAHHVDENRSNGMGLVCLKKKAPARWTSIFLSRGILEHHHFRGPCSPCSLGTSCVYVCLCVCMCVYLCVFGLSSGVLLSYLGIARGSEDWFHNSSEILRCFQALTIDCCCLLGRRRSSLCMN